MKKPTKLDHDRAFIDAVLEQMEDNKIRREVAKTLRDVAVYGTGRIKITKDDIEHIPYDPFDEEE